MLRLGLVVAIACVLDASAPARAESTANMPDHVLQTINRHGSAIRRCYDRGVRTSGRLGGKLVVRFRVDKRGQAQPVTIVAAKSTLRHGAVERCVKRVFRSMRFRRGTRAIWYSSPIVFGA
jgi:hypothetical protein